MSRWLIPVYGVLSYLVFFVSFVYLIGFLAGVGVPKAIDDGTTVAWPLALAVNTGLIALFGVQHSVMARAGFKRVWTRIVPEPAERSTYVLLSSVVLILLYLLWQPLPATVWSVETPWLRAVLWAGFLGGWGLLFVSTWLIDHFGLFGLRQVWDHWRGERSPEPGFQTPLFYKWVRHPMMTGFLLGFWCVPDMSVGQLLFAVGMTAYIVIGTAYEERDLIATFGDRYRDYRERVAGLIPMPRRGG